MASTQDTLPRDVPGLIAMTLGDDCPGCGTTLVYREYKSNHSSYCPSCEMPLIQVW